MDLLLPQGLICSGLWRTEVISFVSADAPARKVQLLPNITIPNGTMKLVGLNPEIQTEVRIYSVTGKLIQSIGITGTEEYLLTACPVTGVFEVQVLSNEDNIVLRYLVKQ